MPPKTYDSLRKCVSSKSETDSVLTREDGSRVVDPRDEWYALCVASKLGVCDSTMTRRGINGTTATKISGHTMRRTFMRYDIVDEADLVDDGSNIEAGRQVSAPSETDTSEVTHMTYGHS
jgi:hypothetical protein